MAAEIARTKMKTNHAPFILFQGELFRGCESRLSPRGATFASFTHVPDPAVTRPRPFPVPTISPFARRGFGLLVAEMAERTARTAFYISPLPIARAASPAASFRLRNP